MKTRPLSDKGADAVNEGGLPQSTVHTLFIQSVTVFISWNTTPPPFTETPCLGPNRSLLWLRGGTLAPFPQQGGHRNNKRVAKFHEPRDH